MLRWLITFTVYTGTDTGHNKYAEAMRSVVSEEPPTTWLYNQRWRAELVSPDDWDGCYINFAFKDFD